MNKNVIAFNILFSCLHIIKFNSYFYADIYIFLIDLFCNLYIILIIMLIYATRLNK